MSGWLGGILSGVTSSAQASANVNLDSLLSKLQDPTSTLEQRKKSLEVLKEVSANAAHHKVIGLALPSLLNVLKADRSDLDIIKDTLQTLVNITSLTSEPKALPIESVEYANVEQYLKDFNNIGITLNLLEERDYTIRYHITQFLRILLYSKPDLLQQAILQSPMGIPKLMDLLKETREIVRNEALLLLLELTKYNQEIQKIIAFEGAFEMLLSIIYEEGLNDGGIIVQDCLSLINNLLKNNVSNQNYFRETSCISKLPSLLKLSSTDMWILTDDKRDIVVLTLDIISQLVTGNNPSTHSNQLVLLKNNILSLLCPIALGRINSPIIRITALNTLADILHSNKDATSQFSSMLVSIESPQSPSDAAPVSVLSRLLVVILNSNDILERSGALRVFKSYLHENEEGQMALASTLTPSPNDQVSLGNLLLASLFSWEDSDNIHNNNNNNSNQSSNNTVTSNTSQFPWKCWFASNILSYIIKDNANCKDLVLRIPLEIPKPGVPMTTLLTKIMNSLTLASRMQSNTKITNIVKICMLKLLCIWMEDSSHSVKAYLQIPTNLPFLVEQLIVVQQQQEYTVHIQGLCALLLGIIFIYGDDDPSSQFNRNALQGIIVQRIGMDHFISKLENLRRTESFIKSEQGKSDVTTDAHDPIYYDYDFTVFYKNLHDKIVRSVKNPVKSSKNDKDNNSKPSKSNVNSGASGNVESNNSNNSGATSNTTSNEYHEAILQSYKELIRQQDRELEALKKRNLELETLVKGSTNPTPPSAPASPSPSTNNKEIESLQAELQKRDNHIQKLYEEISQLQDEKDSLTRQILDTTTNNSELVSLSQAFNELEKLNVQKDETIIQLKHQLDAERPNKTDSSDLKVLQDRILLLENQIKEHEQRYANLEKEQEELLVELANYEIENNNLKAQLAQ